MARYTMLALGFVLAATPAAGQAPHGTLAMAVKQPPVAPVPFLGPTTTGNANVTDQLFLRLATLGARASTIGDEAMTPQLARDWVRRDSVTVDFRIDPRARWHDGVPVTAADVVFTWRLIHEPVLGVSLAAFALIDSVSSVESLTVRVTFTRPSAEQVYSAGYLLQPLPSHLLHGIPVDSLSTSNFAHEPIGNGPYRFGRRVPGQFVELEAVPDFFLGTPGLERLVFRVVPSTDAQVNLLLAGETDVMSGVPATALARIRSDTAIELVTTPGNFISYILFNSRDPDQLDRPHPILSDRRVRQAIALALNRGAMARRAFGPGVQTPLAIRSQAWQWLGGDRDPGSADPGHARMLLDRAGWRDRDDDGIRDRGGRPLTLTMIYPVQSSIFAGMAVQAEQMLRRVGVALVLEPIDGPVWLQRRRAGHFDLDIAGANQDPSPGSLAESWSCASARTPGSSNVGHWCDPEFDRFLQSATGDGYRRMFKRMAWWQPAVVTAAPAERVAVSRRYQNVIIRPSRAWTELWKWRVRPGSDLPRDR